MKSIDPVPSNEQQRLSDLESYKILDTAAEEQFDQLTELASFVCGVPIAYISLIDKDRQWFKSRKGLQAESTPRNISFCQYTIMQDDILEVNDALSDDLFKDNPLVLQDPYIRFYAGAPLVSRDGYKLGSLCVVDREPHKLTERQKDILRVLSKQAIYLFELKRTQMRLEKTIEKAEKNARAKTEFLNTMSHEIRTPLNAIVGISHLMEKGKDTINIDDYVKKLKFSSENLLSLINDVLDFGKIEAGKIELYYEFFNLRQLIQDICHTFTFKARENHIAITTYFDERLPVLVEGDRFRLVQILNNLVSNAVKFTRNGEVTVSASLAGKTAGEVCIRFSVKDTGIGIPADKIDVIFESFSQASPDTTRHYGGTGLGLAITKKLLEIMGSTVTVNSREGEGSEFAFELKCRYTSGTSGEHTGEQEHRSLRGLQVLIAEDNELNAFVIERFMQLWEVDCDIVVNGREAVEKADEKVYDVILLDVEMPVMNGQEASRNIKKNSLHNRSTPLYVMTAYALTTLSDLPGSEHFVDFISKPINPLFLRKVLGHYV